ncbi:MAG: tetratricopeptide repeat protein [Phycisphaerales bacterium]|nr:tetratricopeptide repeat protein [Phycisphaerales bacterium]
MTPNRRHTARALACIAGGTLLLSLAGCAAGHGKFTTEGKEQAEQNQARMKAASRYDLAMQEFVSGDPKRALSSIDQSIASHNGTPGAHILRGRILGELGRAEDGIASFQTAIKIDPANPESYYYLGMAQERLAKPDEALASYQQAATLDRANAQYPIAAAELLIERRQLDQARAVIEAASPEVRRSPGCLQTLGHIEMMQGRPDTALTYFRDAATLSPQDTSLLDDLARAQVAAGHIADAERTLARLLALPKMQNRRDLTMLRARCLSEMDRPVEARDILRKLADTGDADPAVWKRLFELGRQLGDIRLQRQAASTLVAIAPELPDGYLALALCQKDMGEIDPAIVNLEKAIARSTTDPTPAKTLGLLRAQLGDRAGAAKAFRKAAQIDPTDTRAVTLAEQFEHDPGR